MRTGWVQLLGENNLCLHHTKTSSGVHLQTPYQVGVKVSFSQAILQYNDLLSLSSAKAENTYMQLYLHLLLTFMMQLDTGENLKLKPEQNEWVCVCF